MFEPFLLSVTVVGSFLAGIYDLKTSNVPDKLCIAMIIIGLLTHTYTGFMTGDFTNLINSFIFGGIFLAFGLAMYYTGQWGGGDGELLVTIGILVPTLESVQTYFPFSISFFINSFFVGAAYSILYSAIMMYNNRNMLKSFLKKFEGEKTKASMFVLSFLAALFFIYSSVFPLVITLTIIALVIFQKFAKTVEQGFLKRIPVSKLRADDTIGENIPKLGIYKTLIKGLTRKQVRQIKKHRKYVVVREGIRYGIVFPLSVLFTMLFGDLIFFLF